MIQSPMGPGDMVLSGSAKSLLLTNCRIYIVSKLTRRIEAALHSRFTDETDQRALIEMHGFRYCLSRPSMSLSPLNI
jgi:hypothetical protein